MSNIEDTLNSDKLIIVIGRGHSGTRAISQLLYDSGVYMGSELNESYDIVSTYEYMYNAVRSFNNDNKDDAVKNIRKFLQDFKGVDRKYKGWKLPETTLVYPLITKMLDKAKYIFWTRRVYENVTKKHGTDDCQRWNLPEMSRKENWVYHQKMVLDNPTPENFLHVRFEDFVENNNEEIKRLEKFLGIKLERIPVHNDKSRYVDEYELSDEVKDVMMQLEYKVNF